MPRQLVLGSTLAATLAATAWVATQPDESATPSAVVEPVRKPRTVASAPAPQAGTRQPWAEAAVEQFAAWQPPPPPPSPPPPPPSSAPSPSIVAAPPPPLAPPLPYQMIGRLVEGEGEQAVEGALLASPSRALSVKRGDVIDGQWRVEQVSAGGVRLTWLPSKLPQNIVFKQVP